MGTNPIIENRIRVRVFGPQAAIVGGAELEIDVASPVTVAGVLRGIETGYPELAGSIGSSRIAVNHEFAAGEEVIRPDDEVALIGMISGG